MNYYIKATDNKFKNDMANLIENLNGDWIVNPKDFEQSVGSDTYLSFLYVGEEFEKVAMQIAVKCTNKDRHYIMPVPIIKNKLNSDEHNAILSDFIKILKELNIDVKSIE